MKPEIQRVKTVAGEEINLPCQECEAKALKAYRAEPKDANDAKRKRDPRQAGD